VNISRKTQDTIRKAYYQCCHLHDQYGSGRMGERTLGDIMKLAKQDRPTMLARLMVIEHYLEGFDQAFCNAYDDAKWGVVGISGIAHGFQRAFLQGIADGHRANDAHADCVIGLGDGDDLAHKVAQTQRAMTAAWDEHRARNAEITA